MLRFVLGGVLWGKRGENWVSFFGHLGAKKLKDDEKIYLTERRNYSDVKLITGEGTFKRGGKGNLTGGGFISAETSFFLHYRSMGGGKRVLIPVSVLLA